MHGEGRGALWPRGAALSTRLAVQSFWHLVAQGVFYACQLANVAILGHLVGANAVGGFTLGLAIANPSFLIANLSLRTVYTTDTEGRFHFKDYQRLRLLTSPPAMGLALVVCAVLANSWDEFLPLMWVCVAKGAETYSDLAYAPAHKRGDYRPIALSMSMRGLSGAVGLAAGAWYGGVVVGTFMFALAWWCVYLMYDRGLATVAARAVSDRPSAMRELAKFALPIGLATAVNAVAVSFPRLSIQHQLGVGSVGGYTAATQITLIGAMVVNTLGLTLRPRLARYLTEGRVRDFWREANLAAVFVGVIGVGVVATSFAMPEFILRTVYGSWAVDYQRAFQIAAVASIPLYVSAIYGYAQTATQEFRQALGLAIGVLVCTAAATVSMTSLWGVQGAAGALAIQGLALMISVPLIINSLNKRHKHNRQ